MTREKLREIVKEVERAQKIDEDIDCLSENIDALDGMILDDEIGKHGQIRIYLYDENRAEIGNTYVDGLNTTLLDFLVGFKEVLARERAKKEKELQGIEI